MLPAFDLDQLGFFLPAARKFRHWTSWMKLTSGRWIEGAGHLSFQKGVVPLGLHYRIRNRDSRKEGLGIGMKGIPV